MKTFIFILGSFLILCGGLSAQSDGDFRTSTTSPGGNWNATNIWQRYNGTSWVDVTTYPTSADGAIEISANSIIIINLSVSLDQLTVKGTLRMYSDYTFTLANGTGTDLVICDGGSFTMYATSKWVISSGAGWQIQEGGSYIHYSSSATVTTALNACTLDQGSTVSFGISSSTEPYLALSGRTFQNLKFESSSGSVTLRNVTTSSPFTVNGKFIIGQSVQVTFSSNAGNNFNGDIELYGSVSNLNSFTLASDKKITAYSSGFLTMATGKTLTVYGNVYSSYLNSPINNLVTFKSGSVVEITGNVNVVFENATWEAGSTLKVTGITSCTTLTFPINLYNVIWNCPNQTSNTELYNYSSAIFNINGDFTIINTGTGKISNSSSANSRTINVLGDLNLQGGSYHLYSGTGAYTQTTNITSDLNISGGTLDLSSSSNASGVGNLFVKGNINHSAGTITESGIASNKISLNGTTPQTISTAGFDPNSTINFELNNSNGATLLSDLSLYGSFTFTNGKFNLGDKNLTLSSTSAILSNTTTNYFISNGAGTLVRKAVTSETLFPIGTSSYYSPVWATNSDAADDFAANVMTDATGSNSGSDRVKLKYEVHGTRSSFNNGITLKFGWMSASEGTNFKNNRSAYAKMWHVESSSWIEAGTGAYTLTETSEPYTLSRANINSLSPFAIGQNESALPVHLSSFTHSVKENSVTLFWSTSSEENCSGFEVQRSSATEGINNSIWQSLSFIKGSGTTSATHNYSFTDKNLSIGKYHYRIKQTDYNSNSTIYNLSSEVNISAPQNFVLSQNYPNPFNSETIIRYTVPDKGCNTENIATHNTEYVSIKLYDISGRLIKEIINRQHNPGYYSVKLDASSLSSGIYFYSMTSGSFIKTKKLIIMK
ncbi:MAG: T9SS type A sorting domain-containing protein [Ignavibacteriae bacterium]|nr:T9SS type A sorting domain-containing protein [Ignavibacteriota bacterium]